MPVWGTMITCFLIGSIPTAYIIVKIISHRDIRRMGSGNVGTMNVKGQLGLGPALVVLLIDGGKGLLAVWLCSWLNADPRLGLAVAVMGHIYPPWLGFQGGKGLATALGGILGLADTPVLIIFGLIWLPAYLCFFDRDVDKASVAGAAGTTIYALFTGPSWGLILMLLLIAQKHWQVTRQDNRK